MASGATRAALGLKLYKFNKPDILQEDGAHLPQAYHKFYKEWKQTKPLPVHYKPHTSKWIRNDTTGEVKRLQNHPIPIIHPPESHLGIWGGEGIVKGFQKRDPSQQRVAHFWIPSLIKSAIYSEVLDTRMEVTMTERAIDLIIQHKGFDNYVLENKACDLQSLLVLKLKRKILQALYYKELYPDDAFKREEIYSKYEHFLKEYTAEDIDWYGLSFVEALKKCHDIELTKKPIPLKIQLRQEFIQKLMEKNEEKTEVIESPWFKRLNPFSKKE